VSAATTGDGHGKTGKQFERSEPDQSLAGQITEFRVKKAALDKNLDEELQRVSRDIKQSVKGRDRSRLRRQKATEARERYLSARQRLAEELVVLIKEHADEPDVLDGFILLIDSMRCTLDDGQVEIALRHLADPRMSLLCASASSRGGEPWAERLIKEVAEKHPQKEARGQAIFALGAYHHIAVLRQAHWLSEAQGAKLLAEATRYYSDVARSYAEIRTPDGKAKLGDRAAVELAQLTKMTPSWTVGNPAPEIVSESIDGKPFRLSDHRGKVVVVAFWGSWCEPSMSMVPQEQELWQRNRGKSLVLLGISCGDKLEVAKKTVEQHQMSWTSLWDGEAIRGPIAAAYHVLNFPSVYVIDATGIIRYVDGRGEELEKSVNVLLAQLNQK
jgi:peroxiredoxin